MRTKDLLFATAWEVAMKKGHEAAQESSPIPMTVVGGGHTYICEGGVCGFAWILVKPGTCSFARWLVKNGLAKTAYNGGVSYWISEYGQSMERKEAFARAAVNYLRIVMPDLRIYAQSRID